MIIPFYSSSSEAKKLDGEGKLFGVNEFFPFWGKGSDGWLNKTNYTWKKYPEETAIANNDRSKYYGSTKLRRIANELDALLPDAKAMIKQMEDQIPSSDSFRSVGAGRSRLIAKLAAREYGVKDEEFNQGLIANGIVPTTNSRSADGKLDENIRKAKKIIGVDGPITYKLVPFESGRNFAYRPIPDKNLGRFFVLVDINPVPKSESDTSIEDNNNMRYVKYLMEGGHEQVEYNIDAYGKSGVTVGNKKILYPEEGQEPINWNLYGSLNMSRGANDAAARKAGAPLPVCKKCGSYHDYRLECPFRMKVGNKEIYKEESETRVRGRN